MKSSSHRQEPERADTRLDAFFASEFKTRWNVISSQESEQGVVFVRVDGKRREGLKVDSPVVSGRLAHSFTGQIPHFRAQHVKTKLGEGLACGGGMEGGG